jgi:putative ABC transport system permease protein
MGVRERTQEYGVLRAIGFLPRHITVFIVGEAAVVGLAGALLGVGLSIPLINGAMGPMIEENMTAWFPYFRLQPRDALLGLAAGALLAMTAAILPARGAARLQITQALRRVG